MCEINREGLDFIAKEIFRKTIKDIETERPDIDCWEELQDCVDDYIGKQIELYDATSALHLLGLTRDLHSIVKNMLQNAYPEKVYCN